MALPLYNYFTGASSGTTVTTSNSGNGPSAPFDVVTIGSGATVAYSNAELIDSAGSLKIATPATAASALVEWTTSLGGNLTTAVYFRAYVYFATFASGKYIHFETSSSTDSATIWVNGTGHILLNSATPATILTFTTAVNTAGWSRIEGFITSSTTAGAWQISLYNNPDSTTPTETHSGTGATFGANTAGVMFGNVTMANAGPYYLSQIALSSVPIGPAAPILVVSPNMQNASNGNIASIGQAVARASQW
jgi:hypothetical protein